LLNSTCANCDAPLSGPYCSQCGQHVHDSARTLGALLHDGWHVITHLDGRFWGTMGLLLARPGRLTLEYFASRRARYVPPVRLYLVLSILVFALASATNHMSLPKVDTTAAPAQNTDAPATPAGKDAKQGFTLSDLGLSAKNCDKMNSSWPWLTKVLRAGCVRNSGKSAEQVGQTMRTNLPRMMFVFLPLMALVMSALYWFPRRYYVEHLVFFLHNHAALYLAMALQMLLGAVAAVAPGLSVVEKVGAVALCGYAPWYVYRSMRTYFGQGRLLTLFKIGVVSLAYFAFLMITLVLTLIYSVYFG